MEFIEKLKKIQLKDKGLIELRDMLVGTYEGYLRNGKKESLDVIVKLSYHLGKDVGKYEIFRNCSKYKKKISDINKG